MKTINKLEFRPCVPDDEETVFQFDKELIKQYEDLSLIDLPTVLEWVRKKIHKYSDQTRSIWVNGQKSGFFLLRETDGKLELDDFFVFPSFQGNGIGSRVLDHCIRISKIRNMPLFLYVFTRNLGAVKLYQRFGFQEIEKAGRTRIILQYFQIQQS